MVLQQNYNYEILILDRSGKSEITTVKSLSKALGYSEKLWEDAEITETPQEATITDQVLNVTLQISKVQGSQNQDTVFLLSVKSPNFEKLEPFRLRLLIHVIYKLGFVNATVVADNVTEKISSNIYPLIKEVENAVRKKLNKTFTQQYGLNWVESVASKEILSKINQRKSVTNAFSEFVDTQSTLIDFDDLSELLQKSALNNSNIKANWEALTQLRDKVLTAVPLVKEDYNTAQKISKELVALFADDKGVESIKSTDTFKASISLSSEPVLEVSPKEPVKETPKEAVVEVKKSAIPVPTEEKKPVVNLVYEDKPVLKEPVLVESSEIGGIEKNTQKVSAAVKENVQVLETHIPTSNNTDFITESVFLSELKKAEKAETGPFVNLKEFVIKVLGAQGFASGPAYTLSRALSDTGKVTVYDIKDNIGLIVKAIRSN